ncbi:MAG: FHA domain-containing protein [Actinomycetota bacterium]|nr:FHA domain-containing protein [Actinomycetota bacterium]
MGRPGRLCIEAGAPTIRSRRLEKGTIIASALTGKSGAAAGRRIEVTGSMVIGRENADITIEDPEISTRHAEVRASGDALEIEDLGSTNGTFVNGDRISSARTLSPGDVVRFGQSELELEADAPAQGGTVVAASPGGGTSLSPSPSSAQDDDGTLAEPQGRTAGTAGTSGGAPPSVESWSPAPTGAGAGGYSAPPAAAYTPPPSSGYTPPTGAYQGQQQGGQGYGQGGSGSGGSGPGGYGSTGGGATKRGGKGPLIAGLLIALLLIGAGLGYWFFLRETDEDKIRDVITEFGQNIGNPDVCDLVTQRFLDEASGLTGSEAVEACRTDVEEQATEPVDIEIKSVDINGDRATVEAEAETENGTEQGTFELEKQDDGEWLIDDSS